MTFNSTYKIILENLYLNQEKAYKSVVTMIKMKVIAIYVLVFTFSVGIFAGCTPAKTVKADLPPNIKDNQEFISGAVINTAVPSSNAQTVYFDNSYFMKGYFKETEDLDSNKDLLRKFITDLGSTQNFDKFNATVKTLKPKAGSETNGYFWTENGRFDTFQADCESNTILEKVHFIGKFPSIKENKKERTDKGAFELLLPSASPYKEIENNDLSIIISDFKYSGNEMNSFGSKLGNLIATKKDVSIALFAIKSAYEGEALVIDKFGFYKFNPNHNEAGLSPVYCLVIGNTNKVIALKKEIDDKFREKKGKTFFSEIVLSHKGLKSVDFSEVVSLEQLPAKTTPKDKEFKGEQITAASDPRNADSSNANFNLLKVSNKDLFDNYDKEYTMLSYKYDGNNYNRGDKNSFAANILIPIPKLVDESTPSTEYVEYSVDVQKIDMRLASKVNKKYEWTELKYFDAKEYLNIDSSNSMLEIIPGNKEIQNYSDNVLEKNGVIFKTGDTGALKIKIKMKNIKDFISKHGKEGYLSLVVNITAKSKQKVELPEWIKKLDYYDGHGESNNSDYLTIGLSNLFSEMANLRVDPITEEQKVQKIISLPISIYFN